MSELKGACIIGQSGGPTAVINASIQGAIQTALNMDCITKVYGAANGITGVLNDKLYIMDMEDPDELDLLQFTPSAALGSCRYKLANPEDDDTDYKRILEIFKKYNVRYFFYNGGNDSMDTCCKISRYMQSVGYDCRIMGIPKTIDNDLVGTDHCPGFASSAKYIATSVAEVSRDAKVYGKGMVLIMEIMGRDTGWLTASSVLAGLSGEAPDLIYLPETDFSMEKFLADVKRIVAEKGSCFAAVSEGIHYADGKLVADTGSAVDSFGHAQLGGLAPYLAAEAKKVTNVKVRGIELSLLQRCASHIASARDVDEAKKLGQAAVEAAVAGQTDKMVALHCSRKHGYYAQIAYEDLGYVANKVKTVPAEWINKEGNGVTDDFMDYVLPLIQGETNNPKVYSMPRFAYLKYIVEK